MSDQIAFEGTDVAALECGNCSEGFAPGDTVITEGGDKYCTECVSKCIDCNVYYKVDEMTEGPDGVFRCEDCHYEMFAMCEQCENDAPAEDMTTVRTTDRVSWHTTDQSWCESCVLSLSWECDGCRDRSDMQQHAIHTSCCDTDLCESCSDYTYYCESCDESRCDSCGDCENHSSGNVHSADYKPSPVFHRAEGELPRRKGGECHYFGVELELSGDYSMANAIVGDFQNGSEDDWYCKQDGSVNGVEFVSHPRTLASWQAYDLKGFMRALVNAGAEDGRDGLHVHVSRTAFKSSNHYRRFVDLVTRGDDNKSLAEHMAGRAECNWAKFVNHPRKAVARSNRPGNVRYTAPGTLRHGYFERYEVLNVCNRSTVEFRLGCSTTDATALLAVVEYLAAAIEWTRTVDLATEAFGALTAEALWEYILDNMATYSHACEVMAKHMVEA